MDRTVRPNRLASLRRTVLRRTVLRRTVLRRTVLRRLLAVGAVLALVGIDAVVSPTTANACSCVRTSLTDSVKRADVAFLGVLQVSDARGHSGSGRVELTFAVERVYKGWAYAEQIVTTPSNSASCGLDAQPGTALIVFGSLTTQVDGSRTTSEIFTTLCYGNLATATPPTVLGAGYAPLAGSSLQVDRAVRVDDTLTRGLKITGLTLAGLVVLSSLGLVLLWRRRAGA